MGPAQAGAVSRGVAAAGERRGTGRVQGRTMQTEGATVTCQLNAAQAMPCAYRCNRAVEAYRAYYRGEKKRFARWTGRAKPAWF